MWSNVASNWPDANADTDNSKSLNQSHHSTSPTDHPTPQHPPALHHSPHPPTQFSQRLVHHFSPPSNKNKNNNTSSFSTINHLVSSHCSSKPM
ncbi:hypothetical protein Hanom_Chr12g01084971 [Helianthus anomalus]